MKNTLYKFSLICLLAWSHLPMQSQLNEFPCKIILSSDSIDFGSIQTIDEANSTITITNASMEAITIDSVMIFSRWPVFSLSDNSRFTLSPGEIKQLTFRFSTPHNMTHKGNAIIRVTCPVMRYSLTTTLIGKATFPDAEFAFTQNLEGQELYNALNKYLNESLMFSYSDARQFMFSKADNVNGTVECVYTGKTIQTTGIPNINVFNTEHSWPQSKGADQEPARSDIYIIYPSDAKANERRSNHPYGIVNRSISWESGGSKLGLPQASADTVFEPRDKMKGNVARSLLYFATRYGNRKGTFDNSGFLTNMESLIRTWNKLDPVDERERSRAISIASAQKRINPYIAYPEMIDRMFRLSTQPAFPLYPEPVTDPLGVFVQLQDSMIVNIPIINKGNQALKINTTEFRPFTDKARVLSIDTLIAPGNSTIARVMMTHPMPNGTVLRIRFADGIPTLAIPLSTEATTSIQDKTNFDQLTVYPNPAQISDIQTVSFTVPDSTYLSAKVYDIKGAFVEDITSNIVWNGSNGSIVLHHSNYYKTLVLHLQSPTYSTTTLLHTGY